MNSTQPTATPANIGAQPQTGITKAPVAVVPTSFDEKLRAGISRLRQLVQSYYEELYPGVGDWIQRALAGAEQAAWQTPYPSLFFTALAHTRIAEARRLNTAASQSFSPTVRDALRTRELHNAERIHTGSFAH